MARGVFGRLRSKKGPIDKEVETSPESAAFPKTNYQSNSYVHKNNSSRSARSIPSGASAASHSNALKVKDPRQSSRRFRPKNRASARLQHQQQQPQPPQQLPSPPSPAPPTKAQSVWIPQVSNRRHQRRSSFGDASLTIASTTNNNMNSTSPNNKAKSARFTNSRRSSRRQRPPIMPEEEKKEIHSGEEEEEEDDDFFDSPEFRNRVAQEAADLDREGNSYFERGDYDQAFLSYERALKLKRASLQVDQTAGSQDMLTETESQKASILASVATSINNMTYLRQRAGQASADETMAAYLKSLQIKREILGPNHLSVGKTLNNIGSVFYLKKEYVPALKAYENANEIMAEQLGSTHLDVGTVLSNIGDVHSAMQHKTEALEYYRRALDIRWSQLGRNDPKVIRLMEQTAALETGRQPRKRASDLSDSEDEEYAEQDRRRQQDFQDECQALQEELVEDIKFFDLVERTLAIELVKQKTHFMRAMRKAQNGESIKSTASDMFDGLETVDSAEFDLDEQHKDDDGDDSIISVMSAPPDLDLDDSREEAPEVLAFLQEIGAPVNTPTRKPKHTRNSAHARSPHTPAKTTSPKTPSRTPTTASTRALTPSTTPQHNKSFASASSSGTRRTPLRAETASKKPRPQRESPERSPTASNSRRQSSRHHPPATPKHVDSPMRKAASQRPTNMHGGLSGGLTASNRSKSTATLTPDERRLALMSVKERLANLKSKRELAGEGVSSSPTKANRSDQADRIESRRRLYMNATRNSIKTAPPVK